MTILAQEAGRAWPSTSELQGLRSALRAQFLTEAGWDQHKELLSPPRDHPLLGVRECVVADCTASGGGELRMCQTCGPRFRASDQVLDQFCRTPPTKRTRGERLCVVPGCERPAQVRDLCAAHNHHRTRHEDLTVSEWIVFGTVKGLPSFGDCQVRSCVRRSTSRRGLCLPHTAQWRLVNAKDSALKLDAWAEHADPVGLDHLIILRGLPELVQLQVLVGVQHRTDAGVRTKLSALRKVAVRARHDRVGSLVELLDASWARMPKVADQMVRSLLTGVRRALTTPELERTRDVWDLAVFGLTGTLDFAVISQAWMREAAKHWAGEDLPKHRGRQANNTAKEVVAACNRLSSSLRLSRPDHGDAPSVLGRRDVVAFTNRLAHLERTGRLSAGVRIETCRKMKRFLEDSRAYGLTRPGQPLESLPLDFALRHSDIPAEQREDAPRDLPARILRTVAEHLDLLQSRSGVSNRRIAELLIDTGRRPDEVCQLTWDCLERDADGQPVLLYTDFKNHRISRRLPISEDTAAVINAQKAWVRAAFPSTPVDRLPLFPRDKKNQNGTRPIPVTTFYGAHRRYIESIETWLIDEDGEPFNVSRIVPYSYRHSYAQRHADNGVSPDVLRDLMGHKSMQTTLRYYRVSEQRVRIAVDQVARHQFDRHGQRVFRGVSRLLGDEHARMRVGQVAVPFGVCTEPSNVKAGGQACPFKFTCLGCGHFRSDPSYLPELKSHLQQLLADREYVRASTQLDEWARVKAMPADEEIEQLRGLIRRIEADLDDLTAEDQQLIQDAVTTIRKTRQTVSLGMPAVRAPSRTQQP